MGHRLDGRVAIVTGAARGIGRGVALMLAEEGAKVVVADFGGALDGTGGDQGPADDVVNEIAKAGGTAIASYGDVSKYADCQVTVDRALAEFGRVDILCHVAGILRDRMVFNMTEEEWDAVLSVHLRGAFNSVRTAVEPMMRQRYGRVLLFSSGSGLGSPGQANYSAAKEGMVGFSRALSRELGPYGIAVNAIYPGGQTRMSASVPTNRDQLRMRAGMTPATTSRTVPYMMEQDRLAGSPRDPDNNAPPVAWLCTEAGGAISGQVIGTAGWQASRYHVRKVIRSISARRRWTVEELTDIVPNHLAAGIPNPAPSAQPAAEQTSAS
jgi:NAD(P)-dependent dehydrogenase (short-subunit alcohol dehydrogenase family)